MRPVLLPILLVAALRAEAQRTESFTLPGRTIAIYNLAGEVRVERSSSAATSVEVTRQGADAGKVHVETGTIGGANTLRVVYDDDQIVYAKMGRGGRTNVHVARDGRFNERGMGSWKASWGNGTMISGSGRGAEAWADLLIRVPDGVTLTLRHATGHVTTAGMRGSAIIDLSSASADIRDHVGDLNVDAGSGRVSVTGAEADEMQLDLGSGATELRQVKAGDLKIDAGSGSVTADGVSVSGALDIDAGSGSTELRKFSARRAKLDLGSGGMVAEFVSDVDDLRIDSGSGAVTLYLPADVGAEVNIETGSGGLSTDFPITMRRSERHRLAGTLGDGKGRIAVDAGSGSVSLKKGLMSR